MDTKAERRFLLLNARRLSARLGNEEIAILLGFQEHDIPVLIKKKLLKPSGNPIRNSVKYFAAADIQDLMNEWLNKATKAVYRGRPRGDLVNTPAVPEV